MINKFFNEEKPAVFCVKIAMLALIVRFCIGAAYYHVFIAGLKRPIYAFDGEAYSIMGWYIALVLKGFNTLALPAQCIPNDYSLIGGLLGTPVNYCGLLPSIREYGVTLFSYIIGGFYYVFGYAPVLLRFFISGASVLTAFLTYNVARRAFDERTGRISLAIALFMPSFIIYSASIQRDTLINLLVMLVISQVLFIKKTDDARGPLIAMAVTAIALWLLAELRVNAMLVLAGFLAAYLFIRFAFSYRRVALTFAGALLAFYPASGRLFDFIWTKLSFMLNYHLILNYRGGLTYKLLPESYYTYIPTGRSICQDGVSAFHMIIAYLKGVCVFLFGPSPLAFNKIQQLVILPQMLAWYLVVVFAAAGLCFSFKKMTADKLALITVGLFFTSALGLSEANYETLLRHRDMIVPVYIIFAAYGLAKTSRPKKGQKAEEQ
ncbi:MAG: glycosyltransferase family 39 protein [Candidatus Omnitrophica bacterium]|nr:glycosyltransferase family 39 protein [Candidatus Omnitrophota bacterium]